MNIFTDDIVQKGKRSDNDPHAILPDDWHYPITSHTCSYRNPKLLIDVDVRGHNMKRKEKDAFVLSGKINLYLLKWVDIIYMETRMEIFL